MSTYPQNPFESTENLQSIFEASSRYETTKKSSLNTFKAKYSHQTIIQKPSFIQSMSYNFTHFTKFSFTAFAIFGVLASGMSAQAFAPEEYKPTTFANSLFSANKQKDSDPQIALIPDENNNVVQLPECNKALKYPKNLKNQKLNVTFTKKINTNSFIIYSENMEQISPVLYINCSNEPFQFNNTEITQNTKKLNINELNKLTGWFITNKNLFDITSIDYMMNDIIVNKSIEYNFNDKYHQIIIPQDTDFNFNSFQIQDDSDRIVYNSTIVLAKQSIATQLPKQDFSIIKNCSEYISVDYNPLLTKFENDIAGTYSIDINKFPKNENTKIYANQIANFGQFIITCGSEKDKIYDSNLTEINKSEIPLINRNEIKGEKAYIKTNIYYYKYFFEDRYGNFISFYFENKVEVLENFNINVKFS